MPELPEVETIRKGLQKYLVGHTITAIEVRLPKQFHGNPQAAIGAKVIAARRFGKGLVIDLDNAFSIAIHVKMTGQLLYRRVSRVSEVSRVSGAEIGELPDKYTHVVFELRNNNNVIPSEVEESHATKTPVRATLGRDDNISAYLYYRDIRQFGWIKVLPTNEVKELAFFKNLGSEPLKDLTLKKFSELLRRTKTPIKLLLMDQTKIAGIGNIYANDALYRAKIHPKRPASSLTKKESKALFAAIEYVLQKGIEVGGASERDYVNVLGGRGQYQNFFLVYQKAGEKCLRCQTIIEKMVLGGRGTFFCPACQR